MRDKQNPCNVCKLSDCYGCIWDRFNLRFECYHDECFLNAECSCIVGAYDDCYLLTGGKMEDEGNDND